MLRKFDIIESNFYRETIEPALNLESCKNEIKSQKVGKYFSKKLLG